MENAKKENPLSLPTELNSCKNKRVYRALGILNEIYEGKKSALDASPEITKLFNEDVNNKKCPTKPWVEIFTRLRNEYPIIKSKVEDVGLKIFFLSSLSALSFSDFNFLPEI